LFEAFTKHLIQVLVTTKCEDISDLEFFVVYFKTPLKTYLNHRSDLS